MRRPAKVTPARWAAFRTIHRTFTDDAWTDRAFQREVENAGIAGDGRERAFAQRLAYGAVQQAKRMDFVIATLGKRPLRKLDAPVRDALRLGMYELLMVSGGRLGSSSAHAAVDQAVELVRGVVGERATAFTNAILRRAQVDGDDLLAALDPADTADLATLMSMPQWLVERVRNAHGDAGVAALAAQNEPHDFTAFRIVRAGGVNPLPDGARIDDATGALLVPGATAVMSDAVARGDVAPQSLASQLVSLALDPQPGDRVLDMCAAPGGKTMHIAQLVGPTGHVTACELHEHRADSVRALAARLDMRERVTVVCGDARTLTRDVLGCELFDRVLVDAPCSGSGVVGARPDARWKRADSDIAELAQLQRELLARAASLVRPGGVVVYSTCSLLREEDEDVADTAPPEMVPESLPATLVPWMCHGDDTRARTWPHRDHTDGFFIARFWRAASGGDHAHR